jgi:hypothetical protein
MVFPREGRWRGGFLKIGLIHFGFWIADFGLTEMGKVFQSKIRNPQSKMEWGLIRRKLLEL